MSNIAGKAYAMNAITPMRWHTAWLNRLFFWVSGRFTSFLGGLLTLSLIHYARWVILKPDQFPRLSPDQPEEQLKYHYMIFFSNFNGSWDQYVDSFSSAISGGLDKFWTDHYYNAYPMASSNDVKSARRVRDALLAFIPDAERATPQEFQDKYNRLLIGLQHDLSQMDANPVVSLAASAVERRLRREQGLPVRSS